MFKKIGMGIVILAGLLFTFGSEDSYRTSLTENRQSGPPINLAYVNWDAEAVVSHILAMTLEEYGYTVNLTPVDNAVMWSSVASGESDAFATGSLPKTHGALYEQYADDLEVLGPNVEDIRTGLVVPSYMEADSIEDLTDEAGKTVTGIEPGAGQTEQVNEAIDTYDNLEGWSQQTSSAGAMVTALDQAISTEDEIVVSGWTPHWKFEAYDLKFLEDPEQLFSQGESLNSIVRLGFTEDFPEATQIMENFNMSVEELQEILVEVNDGATIEESSEKWLDENTDRYEEWTDIDD